MNGVTARKLLALGGRLGLAAALVAGLVLPSTPAFGIDLASGQGRPMELDQGDSDGDTGGLPTA